MRITVVDCVQSQITVSHCDVYVCRVDFVQRQRWSLPVVAVFVFSIWQPQPHQAPLQMADHVFRNWTSVPMFTMSKLNWVHFRYAVLVLCHGYYLILWRRK